MKIRNGVSVLATLAVLGASSAVMHGCEREPRGPVEKVGKEIDEAVDKVDDAVDPKGPVEKAGRALDRAVDD